jgi:hypothetical protein
MRKQLKRDTKYIIKRKSKILDSRIVNCKFLSFKKEDNDNIAKKRYKIEE